MLALPRVERRVSSSTTRPLATSAQCSSPASRGIITIVHGRRRACLELTAMRVRLFPGLTFLAFGVVAACISGDPSPDAGPRGGELGDPCERPGDCQSMYCGGIRGCLPNECQADSDCGDGLACIYECGRSCGAPAPRGEVCYRMTDVARCEPYIRACVPELECALVSGVFATEGACVPASGRTLDEPCSDRSQCAPHLTCGQYPQRCKVVLGAECSVNDDCNSQHCFEGSCVPP